MAIFTLNGAVSSVNTLKYEQLDGAETVTSANVLPTAAAISAGSGVDKRGLEGTALQSASLAPIKATLGTFNPDDTSSHVVGAQNLSGGFGAQAANQSFASVTSALSNPSNVNIGGSPTNATLNNGGDIANSSTSSNSTSSLSNTSQTNITNITNNYPPQPPSPPNPNPDPPHLIPSGPIIAADLNTGLLPNVHLDLPVAQDIPTLVTDHILAPVAGLVTNTLTDVLTHPAELAEAQTRLATARAAQAERIAALGNAQAAYLRDVGESASSVQNPGDGTLPPTETLTASTHPLIAAAQHAVEEATGIVNQRKSGYWPTLDLRGRTSHNAFAGTSRSDPATQGQLTLNLGYTFIDNGVVAGDTAAARANRKAAEDDLKNTELEVDAARLNAQSNFTEAARRLEESARAQSESAKVINNLANEVKQGNRTVRDLLDAKRDELAAANAWAQAYANRALVGYDLERWQ